jgi:hypothetical protein
MQQVQLQVIFPTGLKKDHKHKYEQADPTDESQIFPVVVEIERERMVKFFYPAHHCVKRDTSKLGNASE